jgi:hypothetical protein
MRHGLAAAFLLPSWDKVDRPQAETDERAPRAPSQKYMRHGLAAAFLLPSWEKVDRPKAETDEGAPRAPSRK